MNRVRSLRRLAINWWVGEHRRIAAGLTRNQLADRIGATPPLGLQRLWHDSDHDSLPLGLLERLCEALDLHPVELFATSATHDARPPAPAEMASDDAVVEAALAILASGVDEADGAVSRGRLAEALAWPLARLDAALATLDDRLAVAGVRIDADGRGGLRGLQPRGGLLTIAEREALHQLRALAAPLREDTARGLYAITVLGQLASEDDIALSPGIAIELQQRGLIRRRAGGFYLDPSADVRFSLLLDNS